MCKSYGFVVSKAGEDMLFYTALTLDGDGGILASAHMNTEEYIDIFNAVKNINHQFALNLKKRFWS